jgi:hypothetical protein
MHDRRRPASAPHAGTQSLTGAPSLRRLACVAALLALISGLSHAAAANALTPEAVLIKGIIAVKLHFADGV